MSQSAGHGGWRFLLSSSAGRACFWLKAAGNGGSCVLKRRTGYFFAGCGLATGVCSAFFTLFRSMVLVSRIVT